MAFSITHIKCQQFQCHIQRWNKTLVTNALTLIPSPGTFARRAKSTKQRLDEKFLTHDLKLHASRPPSWFTFPCLTLRRSWLWLFRQSSVFGATEAKFYIGLGQKSVCGGASQSKRVVNGQNQLSFPGVRQFLPRSLVPTTPVEKRHEWEYASSQRKECIWRDSVTPSPEIHTHDVF